MRKNCPGIFIKKIGEQFKLSESAVSHAASRYSKTIARDKREVMIGFQVIEKNTTLNPEGANYDNYSDRNAMMAIGYSRCFLLKINIDGYIEVRVHAKTTWAHFARTFSVLCDMGQAQ